MKLDLPRHSNISIATDLTIEYIKDLVCTTAKALQDTQDFTGSYMQARLEVLHYLKFDSEYALSDFGKRLIHEADEACQKKEIRDSLIRQPVGTTRYYAFEAPLTLKAPRGLRTGSIRVVSFRTLNSEWVAWADDTQTTELRRASPTSADRIIARRQRQDDPVLVIETLRELSIWMCRVGGIAFIPAHLVEDDPYLSTWLQPY